MFEIDPNPLGYEDVAGFNATIVTLNGEPAGVCLKLRRLKGSDHVLHLRPVESSRLVRAIEQYMQLGNHQGLMMQFHCTPSLTDGLSAQHPYNTLLNMSPAFAPDEAGEVRHSTDVEESTFTGKGEFVTYRVRFVSGETAEFRLHECIAFNIWGFVTKMAQDADLLSGLAGGTA